MKWITLLHQYPGNGENVVVPLITFLFVGFSILLFCMVLWSFYDHPSTTPPHLANLLPLFITVSWWLSCQTHAILFFILIFLHNWDQYLPLLSLLFLSPLFPTFYLTFTLPICSSLPLPFCISLTFSLKPPFLPPLFGLSTLSFFFFIFLTYTATLIITFRENLFYLI